VRGRFTRRYFLASVGASAFVAFPSFARTISGGIPWIPGQGDIPSPVIAARFFTPAERRCVEALSARLIPSDNMGPGAREARVVDFIDSQLAGFYGRGDRWYMRGPFREGTDEQGYQSEFAPALLYRRAVQSLEDFCRGEFAGRVFAELSESEQDLTLSRMEDGELELKEISSKTFFDLVLENTIEGYFCDPIHGGNHDMVGWRVVGFPGARYDYRDFLTHNGERISIEPVGLRGRSAWNSAKN